MSIEQGGPTPEEMGLTPEQSLQKSNPYAAPEMGGVDTNQEEVEKKDYIEGFGNQLRVGNSVRVLRSDKRVEDGWLLQSFGEKSAVVVRVDQATGKELRKVVPVDKLASWQVILEGANDSSSTVKPEHHDAVQINLKEMATRLGIDTRQPGWQDKYNDEIRKRTDV